MPATRAEYQREWRKRNPEKHRQYQETYWAKPNNAQTAAVRARKSKLKLSYGLTPEEYNDMLIKQGYTCAICHTTTPTGKWKVFAVDHCHITNKVRGLLCNECNRGMGLLKDNAELLRAAALYLERNNNNAS